MMPTWLKDTAVLTTLITASSAIIIALITNISNRKDERTKGQFESIIDNLTTVGEKVKGIDDTTVAVKAQNVSIQDAAMKILRYRLFQDLKIELKRGHTTLEDYRELSILFESYKKLMGNGEIEALFEKYKELPIKEG